LSRVSCGFVAVLALGLSGCAAPTALERRVPAQIVERPAAPYRTLNVVVVDMGANWPAPSPASDRDTRNEALGNQVFELYFDALKPTWERRLREHGVVGDVALARAGDGRTYAAADARPVDGAPTLVVRVQRRSFDLDTNAATPVAERVAYLQGDMVLELDAGGALQWSASYAFRQAGIGADSRSPGYLHAMTAGALMDVRLQARRLEIDGFLPRSGEPRTAP
jgi:hypothetical protein